MIYALSGELSAPVHAMTRGERGEVSAYIEGLRVSANGVSDAISKVAKLCRGKVTANEDGGYYIHLPDYGKGVVYEVKDVAERDETVSISTGNTKMGNISSVSLPPIDTCPSCECNKKCYAAKLAKIRPNVRACWQKNLDILTGNPQEYWKQVEASIRVSRFFRFHVSGDIPNWQYLTEMVRCARRNPHCDILCFTKRYKYVNDYLAHVSGFPENLHIILSGWRGLEMENPHQLPEAHVIYRDKTTTARDDAIVCKGNCTSCAKAGEGCWSLKPGQQVVFHEH